MNSQADAEVALRELLALHVAATPASPLKEALEARIAQLPTRAEAHRAYAAQERKSLEHAF